MFSKSGVQGLQLFGEKEQQQTNPKCKLILSGLVGNCEGFTGKCPPREERARILQLQRLMLVIKEYLVRWPRAGVQKE